MINEQNTLTKKCPKCGAPTQHSEITEACSLVNEAQPSLESILITCIKANAFQEFQSYGEGTDPCENCQHNQVTDFPGSFLRMEDGATKNSWHEIHLCPICQTTYSVTPH
ncbi:MULTISPECIES: hypothetical protein [Pelosinus]|uniref:Uncharacterized protein n=1 Tax=Pelosinus fermentans B4 TaxID=1149862 RepID=I8RDP4_9FIRM|nr:MULTISPECIES: hypothetical protein [Pelosinus]EIW17363.1 hypothetical protein FB4_4112 [Pelosinus fermentans B4]EIW23422.1 hypothetical protein FA11_4114 [Pelosinus fermentans A11]